MWLLLALLRQGTAYWANNLQDKASEDAECLIEVVFFLRLILWQVHGQSHVHVVYLQQSQPFIPPRVDSDQCDAMLIFSSALLVTAYTLQIDCIR